MKRQETDHHPIYIYEDLREPLCRLHHFMITAFNTYVALKIGSGKKLTDKSRLNIRRSFTKQVLLMENIYKKRGDPPCQIFMPIYAQRGADDLKVWISAYIKTAERLNLEPKEKEEIKKLIDFAESNLRKLFPGALYA